MEKFLIFLLVFALYFHNGYAAPMESDESESESESESGSDEQVPQAFLWPNFPFFPGLNFPPSTPSWMGERRPDIRPPLPQLPEIRFPPINLPWPTPSPDDSDESDEDIEECPDDGIKLISHPDNCKKYILCMNGDEITELKCPNGMHFSRDLRACTDPDDADCE